MRVLLILICILSIIILINGQSLFKNAACFESTLTNDGSIGYGISIRLFGTNYTYPPIDFTDIIPTCISATYPGTIGQCYDCSFIIDTFTEDERYRLLYAINEDLEGIFVSELERSINKSITWIRYAQADQIIGNPNCNNISYPRFCELSLSNATGQDKDIENEFLFSMGLDIISNNVIFQAGYDNNIINQQWFGIGISDNQINPKPMEGYGLIWSSGISGGDNQEFAEYDLTGLNNVNKQSIQNLIQITDFDIDGIITYQFQRSFNTNDINDFIFTGSEQYINIFAAVGIFGQGTILQTHDEKNFFRASDILLTPSPNASDLQWCDPSSSELTECWREISLFDTSIPSLSPTADLIDVCSTGIEAIEIIGPLNIRGILCPNDNRFYLDIDYNSYNNEWFGIVFSGTMIGEAAIYTSGKNNDLTLGLYAYTNNGKSLSGVSRNNNINWIQEFKDDTNGLRIIYSTPFGGDLDFSLSTESIPIGYAIGDNELDITKFHREKSNRNQYELIFSGTTSPSSSPTTKLPTTSTAKGCDKQDLVPATARMNAFIITFFINCDDDTVTVTIKYDEYNNNWFGIVFSDNMIGPALVYTIGKNDNLEQGLYPYNLNAKDISQVILDDTDNFWKEINETINENIISVTYRQNLINTEWSRESETISIRWAYGTSLRLQQHASDARSDDILSLNLLSGTVTIEKEDKSLEIVHGVLMWLSWPLLASIGIFSSAFRDFLPEGPIWFKIHRGVQATVVIIDLIGFIIAIIFTQQKGNPHFANAHMIIGLIVTILAILQPINAWFRAHPPDDGWPNNKKPTKRIIWEWIHKGFGYISWILACVTIMLGLLLLNQQLLAYLHMFLWCALLLIIYIILKIVICLRSKQIDQVGNANAINEETSAAPLGGNDETRRENKGLLDE